MQKFLDDFKALTQKAVNLLYMCILCTKQIVGHLVKFLRKIYYLSCPSLSTMIILWMYWKYKLLRQCL